MTPESHYSFIDFCQKNTSTLDQDDEADYWEWYDGDQDAVNQDPDLSTYFSLGLEEARKLSEWKQTDLLGELGKFLTYFYPQKLPRPEFYIWQGKTLPDWSKF